MLKIFHNNFFENLSDPIPAFLSTKKFGLLIYESRGSAAQLHEGQIQKYFVRLKK